MKTALLLSGGMDSIALAWWKRPDIAFNINYGQAAAKAELEASQAICRALKIPLEIITIDCHSLGSGDMAGTTRNIHAPASDWWPYRNQLLITLAAMKGIAQGVTHLWIGTMVTDSQHADGTTSFVQSINNLLKLQEGNISIEAPAIHLRTAELIKISGIPEEYLFWAHSCHKTDVSCGNCRGCNKYFETLSELGYVD